MQVPNLICKICKNKFECEIEKGNETCWCFDYPNILSIESEKCICKKCLEKKIKGYGKKKTKI